MREDTLSVLNNLLETSLGGEAGFLRAAEDAQDAEWKSLFIRCAARCHQGAIELRQELEQSASTPA